MTDELPTAPPTEESEESRVGIFDIDAGGVIAFTRDLLRRRSVYEPGVSDEHAVADLVVGRMRDWGWAPRVEEVAPGRPNVIATVEGRGGPGPVLAFEGHLDVVTEGDRDEWTVDPYGAEILDGRLYGRGSADMKAGVAAMLYAVRALQLSGPFPGAVRLLVLSDEEGMMLGARHAVRSGALDGVTGVIICEPEGDEVCASSKGALRLRLDLTGKMAHGAMPHQGRSPLPVLARIVLDLASLEEELQRNHGAHPHLDHLYLTPTVAEAGSALQMNTSPARASLWIDVRTIPGVDHASLVDRVLRIARARGAEAGVEATLEVLDDRPPVETDVDDAVVAAVVSAHRRVTGETPRYGGVPGTTDGTIFTSQTGVPSVVYGPGDKWIAHQADEFVTVESIVRYARVYAEAARRFLTPR